MAQDRVEARAVERLGSVLTGRFDESNPGRGRRILGFESLGGAFEHWPPDGSDAKATTGDDDVAAATRKILGGLQQIGLGVNELRNDHGTGHGRANGVKLGLRQSRLAAGSAVVLASVMIDTLEDPNAPWFKKSAGSS